MRGLVPSLTVGAFAALVTGAAVLSATTAPTQLDAARAALPSNDPAAFAELSGVVGRTLVASSFTVVYQVEGGPYDKIVYQAPNRIAEFSSPSVILNVGIGTSIYTYLSALGGISGGCSGWVKSSPTLKGTGLYGGVLEGLTLLRSPTIRVQQITPTRFQAESANGTRSPKGFSYPSGVLKLVATIQVSHGFVVDEYLITIGPAPVDNLRESVRYSAFDSSPPVTAPPADEVREQAPGVPVCESSSTG